MFFSRACLRLEFRGPYARICKNEVLPPHAVTARSDPESKVAAHRGGERRNRRGFVEAGQLKNVAEKGLVAASIGGAGEGKTMCIGRSGGEGTGGIGGRQPQDSSGHQPRVRGQQAGTFVCASWEEVLLCVQEAV